MSKPIFVVDAFTERTFAGNPAAVCLLDQPADEAWMQAVAGEMNLSETAFLWPESGVFRLRWFTPSVEVDLCGHATLASSFVLWATGQLAGDEMARFETRSGRLTATRSVDAIQLDFPADRVEPCTAPEGMLEALGTTAKFVGRNRMDYLVELESETAVRSLVPDFRSLAAVEARGIIVTARSDDPKFDFVSRFFAPATGVPEDPVTGSAHCALGPYWSARLKKTDLVGHQVSRRGGIVKASVRHDRVLLGGKAVLVWRGELLQ